MRNIRKKGELEIVELIIREVNNVKEYKIKWEEVKETHKMDM